MYLTDDQRRRIDEIARAEGVTLAEVVRRALNAYLDRERTRRRHSLRRSAPILTPARPAATRGTVADVLVDTDIFIDHLRGAVELKAAKHRLNYSVITRAELFAGSAATDAAARLLAPLREVPVEVPVDRAIAERAGRIRRRLRLRMPDALIAATALERKLSLATRNKKHFEQVRALRITSLG